MICADDFGLSADVNDSILELCELRKITHVSVLIGNTAQQEADRLKIYHREIKIGLHLDLFSTTPFRWHAYIEQQFREFELRFGFFPDYVDGHMHCHVYPPASSLLPQYLKSRHLPPDFFVRSVSLTEELIVTAGPIKRVYLRWLNFLNRGLLRHLTKVGVKSNHNLWGIFASHTNIAQVHSLAIRNPDENDVFFLHPGLKNSEIDRRNEYEFAKSL